MGRSERLTTFPRRVTRGLRRVSMEAPFRARFTWSRVGGRFGPERGLCEGRFWNPWVMSIMDRIIVEFEASTLVYPNVERGTADPYIPPKRDR